MRAALALVGPLLVSHTANDTLRSAIIAGTLSRVCVREKTQRAARVGDHR